MREMVHELIAYRGLLFMITWRDIKIRYKQSVMGFLWAIFMPMLVVVAGVVVRMGFSFVSGKSVDLSDIASISVKALPWAFFINTVKFATNSLTGNSNLVTKIYFPREVFPLASVMANLFDFLVASAALTVILLVAQIGIALTILWLPVLLFLLILFTTGAGMLLACANLFFRDVRYIVEILLTFAIFFTPVFYEAKMFGKWESVLLLNPVGVLLESISAVVVFHRAPDLFWLGYASLWSVGTFLVCWGIFHKAEYAFAENV